jgi:phosphoglycerate dehydrogenase-like enzyme
MKIVVTAEVNPTLLSQWQSEFPHVEFVRAVTPAEQIAAALSAEAWIGRVPREAFLANEGQLRWAHATSAGLDKFLFPELVESETIVTNTRGSHATTIAEHTFAMLLGLTRHMPTIYRNQQAHVWDTPRIADGMRSIRGATMVIVGFGNIGRAIGKVALGFAMRVIGVDVQPTTPPAGVEAVLGVDKLDEVIPQADVIAIALPLTAETKNFFDARRIGLLKRSAYLLVLSRGGIVDEVALDTALRAGQLAGAGLDALATEPLPADNPLWDAPNLIITPHNSGISQRTTDGVWEITSENVRRFIRGEPLRNVCDKRAGF